MKVFGDVFLIDLENPDAKQTCQHFAVTGTIHEGHGKPFVQNYQNCLSHIIAHVIEGQNCKIRHVGEHAEKQKTD